MSEPDRSEKSQKSDKAKTQNAGNEKPDLTEEQSGQMTAMMDLKEEMSENPQSVSNATGQSEDVYKRQHFFYSGTQFLLLYGSGSHFFSSQTRGALPFWHYVNLFPFSTGLARDFSPLELRLFLLSARDSNLLDDSSHIFQHCFIPFSHLSGILIIVKRKSPLTQFLFHNMAGKYPTSYRLLLLFIK